ncbi:MAG: helix-turn-helix transcriptional regulator [Microbacterium sp.]|uniref:helix-turn-helix domain-containing protein n=1 Tax=Microbacterium sp. TaxID=51671 RepID=UPI00345982A5|nr:helix-turn-helix transcriptional regulator [Microbacterium sp.]
MTNAALSPSSSGPYVPEWSFAEKFRKARKIAGMEQREFAEALGLTSSTVASYETGRSTPRFRAASPLAKKIQMLTNIDYRWFLDLPDGDDVGPAGIEPTTSTV